ITIHAPATSPLFPFTTLFRSVSRVRALDEKGCVDPFRFGRRARRSPKRGNEGARDERRNGTPGGCGVGLGAACGRVARGDCKARFRRAAPAIAQSAGRGSKSFRRRKSGRANRTGLTRLDLV